MYDIENYYNAESVQEASEILLKHPDTRIISGGSDMLIKIREGKMAGTSLVSIRNIQELQQITINDQGDIVIGALMTFSKITNNPLIQKNIPVLGEAVDQVGGPQIRNIGTIGGNVCNGAVSADSVPTLFSANALLKIRNLENIRIVPIQEFYLGPGRVDLKRGDILTEIIIPKKEYCEYQGNYIKYSMRNAMDIATLSCCVFSKLDQSKQYLEDIRITFGVAAPVPYRCLQTEQQLKGMAVQEAFSSIDKFIKQEINPRDSWRASKEFRIQIGGEIAKRAFKETILRAGGVRI